MPMSYCEIHSAVAGFYVTELDRFTKSQQSGGIIHDAHEKFYLKRIVRMANLIENFGIATCLGEMRHILQGQRMTDASTSECKEARAIKLFYKLNLSPEEYAQIRSGDGRSIIYKRRIKPDMVEPIMAACSPLFGEFSWHHLGYGGPKWASICDQIIIVHKTLGRCWEDGPFSEIVLAVDRLINLAHNTGAFLNKFDCDRAKFIHLVEGLVKTQGIDRTLDAHANGDTDRLRGLASTITCDGGLENCSRKLFIEETKGDTDVLNILQKMRASAPCEVREAQAPAPEFA